MMGYFGNWAMMGGWGLLGLLSTIVWWALIIFAVVALFRWLPRQTREGAGAGSSALNILKDRYAKGEINKQEFEEKKRDLSP